MVIVLFALPIVHRYYCPRNAPNVIFFFFFLQNYLSTLPTPAPDKEKFESLYPAATSPVNILTGKTERILLHKPVAFYDD